MSSPVCRLARLEQQRVAATSPTPLPGALRVPNIIEFVTGADWLNRPNLYPRQATLLKILFLEVELLTDYDRQVIVEWESGFRLVTEDGQTSYVGTEGIAPGVIDRMQQCRDSGATHFREVVLVLGRRAGKGQLGAWCGAYLLWQLLATRNPQEHYKLERTKQLTVMCFAADQLQAEHNQFQDLKQLLQTAPAFKPYLGSVSRDAIRLRTPAELTATPSIGEGSIVIDARASTSTAGRGPAGVALFLDEMAHTAATGQQRSAAEIIRGAAPSLAQFRKGAFTFMASSPASQTGAFYEAYQRALAVEGPRQYDPMIITVQLPSWATYLDWERTHQSLPMWPDGPDFAWLDGPIIALDDDLRREQQTNPHWFRVEYQAQWATTADAYLDPDHVRQAFSHDLPMRERAEYGHEYRLHFDASYSGANFAIAVAHREVASDGTAMVMFDYLMVHEPRSFEGGCIDYDHVENHLKQIIMDFRPTSVTGDQYAPQLLQSLRKWAAQQQFDPRVWIELRHATSTSNWQEAETFKTALHRGQIISPMHKLARDELLFLQLRRDKVVDHPRTGPVRTSDLADCMFSLTAQLLGDSGSVHAQLGQTLISGSQAPGYMPGSPQDNTMANFRHPRREPPGRSPSWGRWR